MRAQLASDTDFAGFRAQARALLAQQVPPDQVRWATSANDGDLFAQEPALAATPAAVTSAASVPSAFLALCEIVVLHSEPQRFALLYRLLWRLQHEPALRHNPLDADMLLARRMAHAVRHDIHKMRAFVRFREVPDPDAPGQVLHVAWFEPEHHIVEANAPWFMRRFTQMHWAILTPQRCVEWDLHELQFRPGAQRHEAPPADAGEQLWLTYYQSIFNPARLKLALMQKEMPRKYWRNLPEAQFISPLAARAVERSGGMLEQEPTQVMRRVVKLERAETPPATVETSIFIARTCSSRAALPCLPHRGNGHARCSRRRPAAACVDAGGRAARRPGRFARPALRRSRGRAVGARDGPAGRGTRERLPHQCRTPFQIRTARQAAHSQEPGASRSGRVPALAGRGDRDRAAASAGGAGRDGCAFTAAQAGGGHG
jgi:probable DNA metabolism protein